AKNQFQLLEYFNKANIDNSYLLLAGEGKFLDKCKEFARIHQLNNVLFLGVINNSECFYSAIDLFALPSLFEGFPMTLIEAQASGLKCVVSDKITKDTNLTDDVEYYPLDNDFYKNFI